MNRLAPSGDVFGNRLTPNQPAYQVCKTRPQERDQAKQKYSIAVRAILLFVRELEQFHRFSIYSFEMQS